MSGIYGFTYRDPDEQRNIDAIGGLEYWNRIYGRTAHTQTLTQTSGIGCHIEHFSDRFPYGGPVLQYRGGPAVVDALLFNRDEITASLGLDADCGMSDEELLLTLIDRKGFSALAQVNGDFAGAIWQEERREWTLFRDHLGVRPLYLYRDRDLFAFSTDMRGLLALPGASTAVNEMQCYTNLIGFVSLSLQNTEFEAIRCALPAAVTQVRMTDAGFELTEEVYWRLRRKKIRLGSDAEYEAELRRLITDSVNRRCDAISGLLGAELSGGLDSSIIDILISRHGREARYFSWSKDPSAIPLRDGTDERKVILDICEQEGIECRFTFSEDIAGYHRTAESVAPPYIDTHGLSYGSAWLRSQGASVVFSGHAGDEGVSHRGSRYELFYNHEYLAYFKLFWLDAQGKPLRLLRALKNGLKHAFDRYKEIHALPPESAYHSPVLNEGFSRRMRSRFSDQQMYFNYAPHKYVMQGGTRPRLDNAAYQGAYNGVRYLFPYVDHRVMDYALSVPRRLYISRTQSRVLFRETFREIMPRSLYEVTYKDLASIRGMAPKTDPTESFLSGLKRLLLQLDREQWEDVLAFDVLEKLNSYYDQSNIGTNSLFLGELARCVRIQNVKNHAGRWREFDEQDKTV